jgi:hypothetical protein
MVMLLVPSMMFVRLTQPLNALSPILVTLSGMAKLVKLVLSGNSAPDARVVPWLDFHLAFHFFLCYSSVAPDQRGAHSRAVPPSGGFV